MKLKVSKNKKAVKQTRSKGRLNRPEDSDGIPVREILSYGTREKRLMKWQVFQGVFYHDLDVPLLPSSVSLKRQKMKILIYS